MPHGLESPGPQARARADNVLPLGAGEGERTERRRFAIDAHLAGFVPGSVRDGSEQWFQSFLSELRPGESLTLRVAFNTKGGLSFGATACAPQSAVGARACELELALREVVASAAPYVKLAAGRAAGTYDLPHAVELRPAGQRVCLDDLRGRLPRPVATAKAEPEAGDLALRLSLCPGRRPDLAAVADLMGRPALREAMLELDFSSFRLDARHRRALQEFLRGVLQASRAGAYEVPLLLLNDRVLHQLKAWGTAGRGVRLSARLFAREPVSGAVLDMLCQALFGPTRCTDGEAAAIDLAAAWPDLDLTFLGRLLAIPAAKARLDARGKAATAVDRARGITLGVLDDDAPFAIDASARKQHIYVLGGTGTGKSTLMLNMIVQDMKAGRGVIVIDPHGDLWEKALQRVPNARLRDLVLVHPTEVRKYGLNLVLANQSLSQLQGDRYQTEVAEAVMSNAANVIAFRVGIADALRLGKRFEPELAAAHLAKLPNFHAAGIVVRGSEVSAPAVFATLPEPKPPRRKKPARPCEAGHSLEAARAQIARLIGRRGAEVRSAV